MKVKCDTWYYDPSDRETKDQMVADIRAAMIASNFEALTLKRVNDEPGGMNMEIVFSFAVVVEE